MTTGGVLSVEAAREISSGVGSSGHCHPRSTLLVILDTVESLFKLGDEWQQSLWNVALVPVHVASGAQFSRGDEPCSRPRPVRRELFSIRELRSEK